MAQTVKRKGLTKLELSVYRFRLIKQTLIILYLPSEGPLRRFITRVVFPVLLHFSQTCTCYFRLGLIRFQHENLVRVG